MVGALMQQNNYRDYKKQGLLRRVFASLQHVKYF